MLGCEKGRGRWRWERGEGEMGDGRREMNGVEMEVFALMRAK